MLPPNWFNELKIPPSISTYTWKFSQDNACYAEQRRVAELPKSMLGFGWKSNSFASILTPK